MQGKEASEQETKAKSNVGIDVSKDWLDIHVLPAGEALRVANTCEGIRRLKRWLTRFNLALVVVEATGKWHRPLRRSLDARVLAQFAAVMAPPVRAPEPQMIEELRELVVARASAVEQQTALKNQRSAATVKFLQRQLDRRIARADQDIAALDAAILKRVKADDGLARRYAILTSIAGIGFVAAASLPELGSSTVKQIAMLAGLAPIADQSGKREGVRVVWGGRANVRRILYLAALTAMRFNTDMKAAYQRMTAAGKAPKLAIIAIARKLAVLANTLISQNRIWLPQPPKHA